MKQYKLRALIMLEPAACEAAARGQLGGMRACCLLQPCRGTYFPALISTEELTARAAMHALITAPLAEGEAEAFFAPGQRFTIWADAEVGHMMQADSLVGQGIIAHPVSWPRSSSHGDRVAGKTAHPARRTSPAAPDAPAAHEHGQQLAV